MICPIDTAGFCTWILCVLAGSSGHSSGERSHLVWLGSAESVPAITAHTNYSSAGRKRDKRERGETRRDDRRKEGRRGLGSREQTAVLCKALPSTCSPYLCAALGGVPWQHRTCQQQGNSTLTAAEGKKSFSPNHSTAGFSIKNTPKLWVLPNKFNIWGNHSK